MVHTGRFVTFGFVKKRHFLIPERLEVLESFGSDRASFLSYGEWEWAGRWR